MIGKKGGAEIFGLLKYFNPRGISCSPSFAFAGRVQGGLLPLPTFTPPRKIGCASIETPCWERAERSFRSFWRVR